MIQWEEDSPPGNCYFQEAAQEGEISRSRQPIHLIEARAHESFEGFTEDPEGISMLLISFATMRSAEKVFEFRQKHSDCILKTLKPVTYES